MTSYQRNGTTAFTSRADRSASSSTRQKPDGRVNARARCAKYIALARAAALTGDAVETENYYQHAEHYFRVMKAAHLLSLAAIATGFVIPDQAIFSSLAVEGREKSSGSLFDSLPR